MQCKRLRYLTGKTNNKIESYTMCSISNWKWHIARNSMWILHKITCIYFLKVNRLIFRAVSGSQPNWAASIGHPHIPPAPTYTQTPRLSTSWATIYEPTETSLSPKLLVHVMVDPWYCTFYGSWQIYNDVYQPIVKQYIFKIGKHTLKY